MLTFFIRATFVFQFVLLLTSIARGQKKKDFYIDKFEKANSQTLTKGEWYTYSDKADGGGSDIHKYYVKDGDKNQALEFSYKLEKGAWQWSPYVTLACKVFGKQVPPGIKAIAYEFKGSAHSFIYRSDNIKDFAFYQKEIPSSNEWTTVIIPLSSLSQPNWGRKLPFSEEDLSALSWQVVGSSGDSGKVAIDNVRLIYTPQHDISAKKTKEITIGHTEIFHSNLLNEDRELVIYLPTPLEQMRSSNKRYPVIYLLDGSSHIKSLSSMLQQLGPQYGNSVFPEMIIIGINNTDRYRDLTPSHLSQSPYGHDPNQLKPTGGGAQFISFIKKELMPHVDSVYKTTSYKVFIGHSLGGLTVINTLIHYPNLFNSYLAIDPSMWWNNQLLNRQADSLLNNLKLDNKRLFIATANTMYPGVDTSKIKEDTSGMALHMKSMFEFSDVLKLHPGSGLRWKEVYYPNDDHGSVPVIANYDGLRYFFDFSKISFTEQLWNDNFNIDSAFTAHYKKVSLEMGYEIPVPEDLMNNYGYSFMRSKKFKQALICFKMNTRNYPNSVNAFDSLGEYFERLGDKVNAIESYMKALSIKETSYTRKKLEKLRASQE